MLEYEDVRPSNALKQKIWQKRGRFKRKWIDSTRGQQRLPGTEENNGGKNR